MDERHADEPAERQLIVLRGNSGSGKTSVALALRERPQRSQFSAADMRGWYRPRDLLGAVAERVIPETSTLEQTIATILADTGLITH